MSTALAKPRDPQPKMTEVYEPTTPRQHELANGQRRRSFPYSSARFFAGPRPGACPVSEVQRLLDELVDALEVAKSEVPDYATEAVTYMRAEAKVLVRRLENLAKAIGDPVR